MITKRQSIFAFLALLTALVVPGLQGEAVGQIVADESTWGVVSRGVEYVITPGGFKEPPGPGEGAGITVTPFLFKIRGTPGSAVTVHLDVPIAFVSDDGSDSLLLSFPTVNWVPDDGCSDLHCGGWPGPLVADTVVIAIGSTGHSTLYFGSRISVPPKAPLGRYTAGMRASYPGSLTTSASVADSESAGSIQADTTVTRGIEVVDVNDAPGGDAHPINFALRQNYPNPFNPSTVISYSIPTPGRVTLKIFDILGREVASLVDGRKAAGNHSVNWNAIDVPGGTYYCRIVSGEFAKTMGLVLMK